MGGLRRMKTEQSRTAQEYTNNDPPRDLLAAQAAHIKKRHRQIATFRAAVATPSAWVQHKSTTFASPHDQCMINQGLMILAAASFVLEPLQRARWKERRFKPTGPCPRPGLAGKRREPCCQSRMPKQRALAPLL